MRTLNRQFSFTAYEAEALGPHVVLIKQRKGIDWNKIGLTVFLVAVIVGIIGVTLTPYIGIAHAEEPSLSDHDQEVMYCKAWMSGTQVYGASADAITTHCNKYL